MNRIPRAVSIYTELWYKEIGFQTSAQLYNIVGIFFMVISFGREICSNLNIAESHEWLVTNGIGGYASGTVANLLTRRYHGLLIAALKPPLARTLLLTKLDETVECNGQYYPLYCNRWADGTEEPEGYRQIEKFFLEGRIPV